MYADDHQFYEMHKKVSEVQVKLQDCATEATGWYDSNLLKGNFKKYGTMIIGKKKEEIKINVKGTEVESYDNLMLLGVNIDSHLNFTEHISNVCEKSSQQVGIIMRMRNSIPTNAKLQLYKTAILLHLTYYHIV